MRALLVNRADAYQNFGGDVVQMEQTAACLAEFGVEAEIALGEEAVDKMAGADVVHLFNLQTPKFTHSMLLAAKSAGKPTAVSTIWWDFIADEVLHNSPKWRLARRLIGTSAARTMIQRRIEPMVHAERQPHREIIARADILLPNSESESRHLRALGPFQTPVCVVPNGIAAEMPSDMEKASEILARHGLEPGGFILIAGRVEAVKNQVSYIQAVAPLGLRVVCAGAIREPQGEICRSLGATLLGRVEPPVLHGLYRLAKVHALPSFRETPGLATLEAASVGTPIVSTDVGSARDYFGPLADYCDPHDPVSMIRATSAALARPKSEDLKEQVLSRYTWRHAAEATSRAYRQILAGG